jgi:hypothetical protein
MISREAKLEEISDWWEKEHGGTDKVSLYFMVRQ